MHLILLQPDYVNYDRVMKKKQYMHLILLQLIMSIIIE